MSCETTSPRLTIVKQTYGRISKTKKASNVDSPCSNVSSSSKCDAPTVRSPIVVPKEEPMESSQVPPNHTLDTHLSSDSQLHSQNRTNPTTPTTSRVSDVLPVTSPSVGPQTAAQLPVKQTSLLQFTSPRTQPPKSLTLTPPRSVPNILRRTPVKQGGGSTRKQTTPKSKSVNLSPILYSPKIKKKNPFFNDVAGTSCVSEQAQIITSYLKVVPQNKKTAPSPKKKSMGSQCNINVPRMMSVHATPPKPSTCSPRKQNSFNNSTGEKVLCNVEVQNEDMMIVSHTVNGRVYSGILVADSHRFDMASQLNCGYSSEQFPSQYHKKLKAKLGLSFESGCESENSDNECTKTKVQKLKYSDYKAMKDSIALTSSDPIAFAEPELGSHPESPAMTPKSRQNIPFHNTSNHNKKSINGLAIFLQEAASTSKPYERISTVPTKTKETGNKSKDSASKSKETTGKSKDTPNKSKDTATKSKETTSKVKETCNKSKDTPNKSKDTPNKSKDTPNKSKETACKSKDSAEKNKVSKQPQPKTKDLAKAVKQTQPRSNPNSPKKQKFEKATIITENISDELKSTKKPKLKFGEKFVQKISPSKDVTSCDKSPSVSEDPAVVQRKLAEVSRHFRMRSHSIDDQKVLSSVLAENSAKLTFVDLEWPVWCPRKLKLEITPMKRGKPARFKLEKNGSKRRRTDSNESDSDNHIEEIFTENNNPFGIGDVVIAKYTPGQGRPYWPGKVLSATGLTVCVLFYNTSDVMQIAKCNVEWFYDGCKEHKISLNPVNASQEWKEALEEAEKDVKSCIGLESIVWGLYEDEWWPARVLDIDHLTYTVEWLDDNSLELLPLSSLTPFLLAYNVRYSEQCARDYNTYQTVVDQAHSLALTLLLETESELRKPQSAP